MNETRFFSDENKCKERNKGNCFIWNIILFNVVFPQMATKLLTLYFPLFGVSFRQWPLVAVSAITFLTGDVKD